MTLTMNDFRSDNTVTFLVGQTHSTGESFWWAWDENTQSFSDPGGLSAQLMTRTDPVYATIKAKYVRNCLQFL